MFYLLFSFEGSQRVCAGVLIVHQLCNVVLCREAVRIQVMPVLINPLRQIRRDADINADICIVCQKIDKKVFFHRLFPMSVRRKEAIPLVISTEGRNPFSPVCPGLRISRCARNDKYGRLSLIPGNHCETTPSPVISTGGRNPFLSCLSGITDFSLRSK